MWLIARFSALRNEVTNNLDDYKLLEATRAIREFVAELSQWYIRRSRDRFKDVGSSDHSYAVATTRFVIAELAKLLAPFTPYLAEEIWQQLRTDNDPISVHLCDWPAKLAVDDQLLKDMDLENF